MVPTGPEIRFFEPKIAQIAPRNPEIEVKTHRQKKTFYKNCAQESMLHSTENLLA